MYHDQDAFAQEWSNTKHGIRMHYNSQSAILKITKNMTPSNILNIWLYKLKQLLVVLNRNANIVHTLKSTVISSLHTLQIHSKVAHLDFKFSKMLKNQMWVNPKQCKGTMRTTTSNLNDHKWHTRQAT